MKHNTYQSCAYTPAEIAEKSANSGEIIYVECADAENAEHFASEVECLLDENDSHHPGSGPIEVWGELDGDPVRVHIVHG